MRCACGRRIDPTTEEVDRTIGRTHFGPMCGKCWAGYEPRAAAIASGIESRALIRETVYEMKERGTA